MVNSNMVNSDMVNSKFHYIKDVLSLVQFEVSLNRSFSVKSKSAVTQILAEVDHLK